MANRLILEQSPYLLQHAHNPVDWYPWGGEAFEKAKRENKPVIISIGYSACHWCHVMERESFENEAVATYMNEHFVCIKVDREEHPDVDLLYMDAVQAVGGSGGWPLNVFTTPGKTPFYGGTYYPPVAAFNRPSWMQLLRRMDEIWREQPDEVALQAKQLIDHLKQASIISFKHEGKTFGSDTCLKITDSLLQLADKEKGGFGAAPKFPGTMAINFLLGRHRFTGDKPALEHALRSIDAMIAGGIYDQLGGGFARYSTDREWLAPHFEKMLYDNALLVGTLCDAYSVTQRAGYRQIIEETIAFTERELKDKSGGYYCALDADSEGEEGRYYTWRWEDWNEALNGGDEIAAAYFGVLPDGNWEKTNILHEARSTAEIAAAKGLPEDLVVSRIAAAKGKLFAQRAKRVRPATDDKCLLSWNALMNIALCKASASLREQKYASLAEEHMNWMLAQFRRDGAMHHCWKHGQARIPAKLDDFAYLIQALLQLGSLTGEEKWILTANELIEETFTRFSGESDFFYYSPADQNDIVLRKVDLYDGATPSANAVMADNLITCGLCMEKKQWLNQAHQMLLYMEDKLIRYGYSFGYWASVFQKVMGLTKTIICTGAGADAARQLIAAEYLPEIFLLTSEKEISNLPILENKFFEGGMRIFVCTDQACLSPVSTVREALHLLNQ